jgi:arylsulfatase A
MKRMILAVAMATVALSATVRADAPARPNILFIFSDDYGIDGVSCYGSDRFKGKTPNMDALAKSGIRFEQCYSTPLCGPSRCTIMTGRYGFRTGGMTNQAAHNPSSKHEPSVAKVLKQAGYATGMAGKWRQMGETPGDWGFDEYITDPTAGGWYWQKSYTKNGKLVETEKEVYCPDVCLDFAVDFMRRHRERPFYFYYPTHLVHGPILRTPDTKPGTDDPAALYDDNVAYLDKQVGKLVEEVDRLGLRERTVILFSADNGTARFGSDKAIIGGRHMNGMKGTMLEGGSRVPLIVNWKGTSPQGRVLKDLVDFSDFFATFADLAGAKTPTGVTLDSHSFAPQLRGEKGNPREWAFVQLGAKWYVRDAGWKLTQAGELFDLADAPFVEKPISADTQDEKAKTARQRLQTVLDKLNPAAGKTVPPEEKRAAKAAKKAKRGEKKKKKQADAAAK